MRQYLKLALHCCWYPMELYLYTAHEFLTIGSSEASVGKQTEKKTKINCIESIDHCQRGTS